MVGDQEQRLHLSDDGQNVHNHIQKCSLVPRRQDGMDSSGVGEIHSRKRHHLPFTRSFKVYDYQAVQGSLCYYCDRRNA